MLAGSLPLLLVADSRGDKEVTGRAGVELLLVIPLATGTAGQYSFSSDTSTLLKISKQWRVYNSCSSN